MTALGYKPRGQVERSILYQASGPKGSFLINTSPVFDSRAEYRFDVVNRLLDRGLLVDDGIRYRSYLVGDRFLPPPPFPPRLDPNGQPCPR